MNRATAAIVATLAVLGSRQLARAVAPAITWAPWYFLVGDATSGGVECHIGDAGPAPDDSGDNVRYFSFRNDYKTPVDLKYRVTLQHLKTETTSEVRSGVLSVGENQNQHACEAIAVSLEGLRAAP